MASHMAKRTRTHEQCSHEQHEDGTGGEGVATGDDCNTDIGKSARQKMPKGGKHGLTVPTKNV